MSQTVRGEFERLFDDIGKKKSPIRCDGGGEEKVSKSTLEGLDSPDRQYNDWVTVSLKHISLDID